MRFLSKKCILILMLALASIGLFVWLERDGAKSVFINNSDVAVVSGDIKWEDNTVFNLSYENKVWTYTAKDFKINSKIFSIDSRINSYNRNGTKEDKVRLINKLIDIKK